MPKIVSVHSFRGGTGKSNTAANISSLLAMSGRRVGGVDTDIHSPGIHVLFGLGETKVKHSLNDYLWGKCEIAEAAQDVTATMGPNPRGKLFLIPSAIEPGEIARILREGYDVGLLNDGFYRLVKELKLDVLVIDTHPGLNEETLLSIAISNVLAIIMRPDQQDYLGTAVTVEVARNLDIQRMMLIVNKCPPEYDFGQVKARVEKTYNCEVGAVLPYSGELMRLASNGVFAVNYPEHS